MISRIVLGSIVKKKIILIRFYHLYNALNRFIGNKCNKIMRTAS